MSIPKMCYDASKLLGDVFLRLIFI